MPETFTKTFHVGWRDMDFNAHMRNTSYLDVAADVRMMYFEEHGLPMREFERLRVGPVVMRDEIVYRRELRLLERMDVTLVLAGLSDDGSHFLHRNVFYRADGEVAATVTSEGGWLSFDTRRIVAAPEPLLTVLKSLTRTDDFQTLPSSVRT